VASTKNIKKAFALFDKDNNGTIDLSEFQFALPTPSKEKLANFEAQKTKKIRIKNISKKGQQ